MKNLHLRARALKWCFFIIFKTSMTLPMGDLWLMENRIFAPVEICKFPGFNIGIFDHAIPTGVIAVISSITSHESQSVCFFRSSTWLTEPRRYSNTPKAWSH